jgi:hypothetical protein
MGCAGSSEGEGYSESAVKVKDNTAAADQPTIESDSGANLPAPTGEAFYVVYGDKILLKSYLAEGTETTVRDVISFCNWKLDENKAKLPEGYAEEDLVVTGMTSPHVMDQGLIFCPDDRIDELDGWEEGERYLVALHNKNRKVQDYVDKYGGDLATLKDENYWVAHKGSGTGLVVEYETDLRGDDVPEKFQEKAE